MSVRATATTFANSSPTSARRYEMNSHQEIRQTLTNLKGGHFDQIAGKIVRARSMMIRQVNDDGGRNVDPGRPRWLVGRDATSTTPLLC
jgi:hypothetical protein